MLEDNPGAHARAAAGAGLCLAAAVLLSSVVAPATAGDGLPDGFAGRVQQGWLPPLCVRQGEPDTPTPTTRCWAASRCGGSVRVLFICGSRHQFEALSLARSFDLACDIVPLWPSYAWRQNDRDPDTMNLLRYYLQSRSYDAIAMTGAWLSALPDDCQQRMRALVREQGVGLLYALPGVFPRVPAMQGKPSPVLDPLLPLGLAAGGYKAASRGVAPVGSHALARGADFAAMRWVTNTHASLTSGAQAVLRAKAGGRVLAAVATRGKGRVVAYNRCYGEMTRAYPFLPLPMSVTPKVAPEAETGKRSRWLDGVEYADQFYAWLGRAILWAARKEPALSLESLTVKQGRLDLVAANSAAKQAKAWVRVVVRSPYDSRHKLTSAALDMPARGDARASAPLPDTGLIGRGHIDVFLLDDKERVWDWASLAYERPGSLVVRHEPDYALYKPDADVPVRLQIQAAPGQTSSRVHVELYDLAGRLLVDQRRAVALAKGKPTELALTVALGKTGVTTRLVNLRVTVCVGDEAVEVRDQLFVRQSPDWDAFHIMAYGGVGSYGHPDAGVMVDVLKRMGHDTLLVGYPTPFRMRVNTETGCRIVANNIVPWQRFDAGRLTGLARWLDRFSPVLYELQDEPELQMTPAIEGAFASPKRLAGLRTWLKRRYGSLEGLNAAWGTAYSAWDKVQRKRWRDVADGANWAPWFDSRRELDYGFCERYGGMADAVREAVPDALCSIKPAIHLHVGRLRPASDDATP